MREVLEEEQKKKIHEDDPQLAVCSILILGKLRKKAAMKKNKFFKPRSSHLERWQKYGRNGSLRQKTRSIHPLRRNKPSRRFQLIKFKPSCRRRKKEDLKFN